MSTGCLVFMAITVTPKLSSLRKPFIMLKTAIWAGLGGAGSSLLGLFGAQRRGDDSGKSWGISLPMVSAQGLSGGQLQGGWISDTVAQGIKGTSGGSQAEDGLPFLRRPQKPHRTSATIALHRGGFQDLRGLRREREGQGAFSLFWWKRQRSGRA